MKKTFFANELWSYFWITMFGFGWGIRMECFFGQHPRKKKQNVKRQNYRFVLLYQNNNLMFS